MKSKEFISIEQLDENLRQWFKEKWVRFGPDGKIRGACARGDDSEGKPKCLPQSKAHSLGKKGRASAAARKRREDPNPERSGKAINVNTKKKANEGLGDTKTDILGTYKGYKFAIETQTEDDRYVKFYSAIGPDGQEHRLPKGTTVEEFKKFVDSKQGVAEEQLDEKCWDTHKQVGMKSKGGKMVPNCVPKESVTEMDKSAPQPGRDGRVSHSTYGSRDKGGSKGPEKEAKPITAKKAKQDALDILKKQGVAEEKCPHCGEAMFSELMINEKKDACYYKVKSRYKVWPSAYASGALVKCRKKGASNWGTGGKKNESTEQLDELSPETLARYKKAAGADASKADKEGDFGRGNKRFSGIVRATKKEFDKKSGVLEGISQLDEKWSEKYKRSINCNNPKGFSQRAHCQGRKKK